MTIVKNCFQVFHPLGMLAWRVNQVISVLYCNAMLAREFVIAVLRLLFDGKQNRSFDP